MEKDHLVLPFADGDVVVFTPGLRLLGELVMCVANSVFRGLMQVFGDRHMQSRSLERARATTDLIEYDGLWRWHC